LFFEKYFVPSEEKVDKSQNTEPNQNMDIDLDYKIPTIDQNLAVDTDNLVYIIIVPLENLFEHKLL
jgi:hypothetical protein